MANPVFNECEPLQLLAASAMAAITHSPGRPGLWVQRGLSSLPPQRTGRCSIATPHRTILHYRENPRPPHPPAAAQTSQTAPPVRLDPDRRRTDAHLAPCAR